MNESPGDPPGSSLEPDRLEGAPHPRKTGCLIGQDRAEQAFLEALRSGRLHHAWLIHGPRGVGKATLAWKIARFLLSTPADGPPRAGNAPAGADPGLFADDAPPAPSPTDARGSGGPVSLDQPSDTPLARRLLALSEPRLFLLRRPCDDRTGRPKQQITVDEVRRLKDFFALSAVEGGRRVVIVDSADEMNTSAANALLKLLEEPPAGAVLLLVSHQPTRLLPTIRSRCRELRCMPLGPDDLVRAMSAAGCPIESGEGTALAALAAGSVGDALRLAALGGLEAYQAITDLFRAREVDRARALKLAESAAGSGAGERLDLLLHLFDLFLSRLARTGVSGPPLVEAADGEATLLSGLAPSPAAGRHWAALQQELGARARRGRAVNLDPAALILDMIFRIEETAAECAAR